MHTDPFPGMASARWDWNHFPYDLLDAWTNRAPREAAAWLASIANLTAGGHIAAERIARKLGEQDIAAAAAWVQSLPAGFLRDYAASGLAGAQAEHQPADAMRSALGIQESGKRREMISRLAWHGTEGAAAAEQRLREAGVSADEIAWVLSNPIRMKP